MKYVTKNCEVRNFNVTLYDKSSKTMFERRYSDDSRLSDRQLEKAAAAMFNAKVLDMELVGTVKGLHRMSNEEFVKASTLTEKAQPGCVNRQIAVTDYTIYLYDKQDKTVKESGIVDYDEREPETILKDVTKALAEAGDSRIAVDIEPRGSAAGMRSVPLSVFMENAEKVGV